jgi:hypothetical protein
MSDRREYYKIWREKNKEEEQRKYRIRYTKRIMKGDDYLERYNKWIKQGERFGYLDRLN